MSDGLYSYGLYSDGLDMNGLYSYGLHSDGLCSYGLYIYGLCSCACGLECPWDAVCCVSVALVAAACLLVHLPVRHLAIASTCFFFSRRMPKANG